MTGNGAAHPGFRRTRIKICGITRQEDLRAAVALGADALGFVFYPKSPRYVTPEQASVVVVGKAADFIDDLRKIRPEAIVIPASELDLSRADLGLSS